MQSAIYLELELAISHYYYYAVLSLALIFNKHANKEQAKVDELKATVLSL